MQNHVIDLTNHTYRFWTVNKVCILKYPTGALENVLIRNKEQKRKESYTI